MVGRQAARRTRGTVRQHCSSAARRRCGRQAGWTPACKRPSNPPVPGPRTRALFAAQPVPARQVQQARGRRLVQRRSVHGLAVAAPAGSGVQQRRQGHMAAMQPDVRRMAWRWPRLHAGDGVRACVTQGRSRKACGRGHAGRRATCRLPAHVLAGAAHPPVQRRSAHVSVQRQAVVVGLANMREIEAGRQLW